MQFRSPFILLASFGLLFAMCKRSDKNPDPSKPYPTLEDQRAQLKALNRPAAARLLDSAAMINDLAFLSSAICEGRRPGLAGHKVALDYVTTQMRAAGVDSFNGNIQQQFSGIQINNTDDGTNVIGWIKGTKHPDKFIVLSAHYDHLGKTPGGAIYYGADDNASGTAALLGMARYFKSNAPECSIVFAAFDREETGFEGSEYFVHLLPQLTGENKVVLNINMDMIARSDNDEIFACGVAHYPQLSAAVSRVQKKTKVILLMGHDGGTPGDDWTVQSDHVAFHQAQIPFVYIGVEDHPDYHHTTDTFDKVIRSRFTENANMVLELARTMDEELP